VIGCVSVDAMVVAVVSERRLVQSFQYVMMAEMPDSILYSEIRVGSEEHKRICCPMRQRFATQSSNEKGSACCDYSAGFFFAVPSEEGVQSFDHYR
jgi:hypothetical protein